MKPINFLNEHCEFENKFTCYVLLAVSRKKDVPHLTNSQEIVFREIIRKKDDVKKKYERIRTQAENYRDEEGRSYPFYIYISLNGRDSLKAFHKFQHKMVDWNHELVINAPEVFEKIRRTDRQFISVLASPESRTKKRYFMIDYDQKTSLPEFKLLLSAFDIEVMMEQETKNGYHFKVKPFNRKAFPQVEGFDYEIKTDAQLFVSYVPAKEIITPKNIIIKCMNCESHVSVPEDDWEQGQAFKCFCGGERFKR